MRAVDSAVAVVNVLLHVAQVVVLEPELRFFGQLLILCFQRLAVDFEALAQILLGVGEEIVRAGPDEI